MVTIFLNILRILVGIIVFTLGICAGIAFIIAIIAIYKEYKRNKKASVSYKGTTLVLVVHAAILILYSILALIMSSSGICIILDIPWR